jgi:hypothetical protein
MSEGAFRRVVGVLLLVLGFYTLVRATSDLARIPG